MEALGGLDGVDAREDARDPIGRPATASVLGGDELIVDPSTSATRGGRQVKRGRSKGYAVHLEQRKVDSTNERP